MISIPDNVNGYIPLPLRVGSKEKSPKFHICYVKKHQSNDGSDIADRSIFLVNLPTDTTIKSLKNLSQSLGNTLVQDFIPSGGNNGILVLVDKTACKSFLSKARAQIKSQSLRWKSADLTGKERYLTLNRLKYKDEEELQAEVDQLMEDFSQQEERRLREIETMAQEIDEDGFIKVVNTKRKSVTASITAGDQPLSKKKKKSKEKKDFYRFQIRDQKKHEMNQLLRRFQEDKRKVAELKEKKRFKPY